MTRIVIVGCNAAGTAAAACARMTDPDAEIWVISEEKLTEYSRCTLPYIISGRVKPEEAVVHPESFYVDVLKCNLLLGARATSIDLSRKRILVEERGKRKRLDFDGLVLATGARPKKIPLPGSNLPQVFTLRTMGDALKIKETAEQSENAVVIGAGMIGMEVAEALSSMGLSVTVIEILPSVLPTNLDPDMGALIQRRAEKEGVRFVLGKPASKIIGDGRVKGVEVKGEEIPADLVVMCVGVVPRKELAEEAGIEVDRGIVVDEYMRTSARDVYAAGDCAEYPLKIGGKGLVALGSVAVRSGAVAGINVAGGRQRMMPVLGSATAKLFGLEVAFTGINSIQASSLGIEVSSARIRTSSLPEYFPGGEEVRFKLIVDKRGRIVGAQCIGPNASKFVDMVSFAIQAGFSLEELWLAETCYAPPVSPVWSPLNIAARALLRKLR